MSIATSYFLRLGSPVLAEATASGGPISILRISGSDLSIYNSLFSKQPQPGKITYTQVANVDNAVVLFFKSPHSFTGEDVLEIQCHGVSSLIREICLAFYKAGAKEALPGEFTFRAVMNKKMTLEEAEALNAALSDSSLSSTWAKNLVGLSVHGNDSAQKTIQQSLQKISRARGRVEAAIDYPEAEGEQAEDVRAASALVEESLVSVESLLSGYENFSKSKSEPRVVILGEPNVGKSTLLNILVGGARSIVSDEAGTTRDFIDGFFRLRSGARVLVTDTAGIRYGHAVSKVESAGVDRSLELAKEADAILFLLKSGEPAPEVLAQAKASGVPLLIMSSHADQRESNQANAFDLLSEQPKVVEFVEKWLNDLSKNKTIKKPSTQEAWISRRQYVELSSAATCLREATLSLQEQIPIELCGAFLLEAERHMRSSVGEGVSEEYIAEIFSQFCLGK